MMDVITMPYDGVKQSSTSLHHQLTQNQLRKREISTKMKNLSAASLDAGIFELKENSWNQPAFIENRPVVGLSCVSCTPTSRGKGAARDFISPMVDIIHPETSYQKRNLGLIKRSFGDITQCLSFTKFKFQRIFQTVLNDENVKNVIQQEAESLSAELGVSDPVGQKMISDKLNKRAYNVLLTMHSKLSDLVIRISSWVFLKTLPLFFRSMAVPQVQIEMLKKAAEQNIPVIYIPLHRSHVDYIAITLTLCLNGIRAPLVAAGENLKIPIFGRILLGLGAFFIKRRIDPVSGKKDKLYRAILHTYITQSIQAGHSIEFFIEGGRTRTGKPITPKGGLLSVFVDAYHSGLISDALLVPVSVNYEKIVEGTFVRELTGEPKKPESFLTAVQGIWKALTAQYGMVRVDFNEPFSLHELVRSFNQNSRIRSGADKLHTVPSSASLYGTDVVVEEQRQLVDSIARHIVYDCTRSTSVMSTNALAFLLLNVHRDGVNISDLVYSFDRLREELKASNKDTGFVGESKDVIIHAVELLGPGLIKTEFDSNGVLSRLTPITMLPNVIELSYYSYALLPHFSLSGVVATALTPLMRSSSKISLDGLFDLSSELCDILQFEFIFTKPCQTLNDALYDTIDAFATQEILTMDKTTEGQRVRYLEFDEEDGESRSITLYSVNLEHVKLPIYSNLITPLLDTYCCTVAHLCSFGESETVAEPVLVKSVLHRIKQRIDEGVIKTGESLSTDAIRNCLRLVEKWSVVSVTTVDGIKVYSKNDDPESALRRISQFRS